MGYFHHAKTVIPITFLRDHSRCPLLRYHLDERWAVKVIKEATSFVLARIISIDKEKGFRIELIKTLGGKELKDSLFINDFHLREICSPSGHVPEIHSADADSAFIFIWQNKDGKYCVATPSAGFDYVKNGKVRATFRHSYHQALMPFDVYGMP